MLLINPHSEAFKQFVAQERERLVQLRMDKLSANMLARGLSVPARQILPISKRSIPPVAAKPARERSQREKQLLANAARMRAVVARMQRNK